MKSYTNSFGESVTKWSSHSHPSNPDFMQIVNYHHVVKKDGANSLYWNIDFNGKRYAIFGIDLQTAISKFPPLTNNQ